MVSIKDDFDTNAAKTARGGFNFIAAQGFRHNSDGSVESIKATVGPDVNSTPEVDNDATLDLAIKQALTPEN